MAGGEFRFRSPVLAAVKNCGSELARDGVGSVAIYVDWSGAIASRLAPTVFRG